MLPRTPWLEMESEIHVPGMPLPLLGGVLLTIFGAIGTVIYYPWTGPASWPANVGYGLPISGALVALGLLCFASWLHNRSRPDRIRHARPEAFPGISDEPVVTVHPTVIGRLSHELVETHHGWEFRGSGQLAQQDVFYFIGFGVLFLLAMIWPLGSAMGVAWGIAALLPMTAGLGFVFIIALALRSGYSALSRCVVPRDGGDVEIDLVKFELSENPNPGEALQVLFGGNAKREIRTIPRVSIAAIQACPWKLVIGDQRDQLTVMALQGVLVVRGSAGFERLPLMLTGDFRGAARLLQRVAEVLEVPYFFHGDVEGWNEELSRAQSRPRLKAGGFQS